ncbi:MAG TPA: 3'-5' exonuclease [Gemmatimonadales bacterium]|nr:3'-5' exonuclease [Gemmatimonadales bacterium]
MTGLAPHPAATLAARVLDRLAEGPETSAVLCAAVFGLADAPSSVAERLAVALLGADPRIHRLADGRWALVAEVQGSPLLEECAFAVVDVETTGMRASGGDRVTEIAVAVLHGRRREVVFESLVNPERRIPSVVASITGITDAMVRGAPTFAELADQVLAALGGRVFVAHNARFDWGFVGAELRRARDLALDGPRLCTVRLARKLVRGVGSCGLDSLTHHFGFANAARHRAAGDAMVTAQLLARLLELAREAGARTLQDLAALEARSSRAPRRRRAAMPTEPRGDSCLEGRA